MFVYSSVFTSFQSAAGSTASASDCEDSSNAMVVANAAPAALKKPLRDRFMSSFSFLLVFSSLENLMRPKPAGERRRGHGETSSCSWYRYMHAVAESAALHRSTAAILTSTIGCDIISF